MPSRHPRFPLGGYCVVRDVQIPGANIYLSGAVSAGVVALVRGAHLHLQATEDSH